MDAQNAQEMLRYDEPVLCFDILANQFHSYDLEITQAFYDQLATVGRCLQVDPSTYHFNQELQSIFPSPSDSSSLASWRASPPHTIGKS